MWQYIAREELPLPSLYFSHEREVVEREGLLLAYEPDIITLLPGEGVVKRKVRCRTIGDVTCTGLTPSEASSLDEIIAETAAACTTERGGRADDKRSETAMES